MWTSLCATTLLVVAHAASGCRIFGVDVPCEASGDCPSQLPHCVSGACQIERGPSESVDAGLHDAGDLSALDDEFEGARDLLLAPEPFTLLYPGRLHAIATVDGALHVVPENPPGENYWAWFADEYGAFLFREVSGDFAVSTRVAVHEDDSPSDPPTGLFSAGGVFVRDPTGTHAGDENSVLYTLGAQSAALGFGRTTVKTVESVSGALSNPQTFDDAALLLCRVGDVVALWWWSGSAWIPERFVDGTTEQLEAVWPEIDTSSSSPIRFTHDALPDTLQVGLIAHTRDVVIDDFTRTRAVFDHVRFARPSSIDDCPTSIGPP